MKEREMKIAKEVIEKGEGKHMYTGEQLLFRLSIQIPNENIKELVDKLKKLSIVPRAIFKTSRGLIIEWWTMRCQIILDSNNFIKLIEEFLDYVDSIGFDEWIFDTGCLGDDLPAKLDNSEVIINPRFTVENFNNTREIEVND